MYVVFVFCMMIPGLSFDYSIHNCLLNLNPFNNIAMDSSWLVKKHHEQKNTLIALFLCSLWKPLIALYLRKYITLPYRRSLWGTEFSRVVDMGLCSCTIRRLCVENKGIEGWITLKKSQKKQIRKLFCICISFRVVLH